MNRYKEARHRAGLSQKAAAISLGVRPPSMSDWESGKSKPTHEHLVAMAALYGTTTDYLTGAESAEKKQPADNLDGLRESTIRRITSLPDPVLVKLLDLLDAVRSYQADGSAAPADRDPSSGSDQ